MNLADPSQLHSLLNRHGLKARKGLGQHFLTSATVVDAIVAAALPAQGVLEIGPGPGVLTGPLSEAAKVIALELDAEMIPVLAESAPDATIVRADALQEDLAPILLQLPEPRAVVSNLPYYITGPLLERISEQSALWTRAVLMMQREVGKRILAPVGNSERGALSVCLQAQFDIRKVCDAPAGAFSPPPKVESIVLCLTPRHSLVPRSEFHAWRSLVRSGFRMPRKTIWNNLAATLGRDMAAEALREAGIDPQARPQTLDEAQWAMLYQCSRPKKSEA